MSTLISEMIASLQRRPENAVALGLTRKAQRSLGVKVLSNLMDSRRFHLSSKTTQVAANLALEAKNANAIASLAQPLFQNTWLEWNLADQFIGVGQEKMADAPERVGVMCSIQNNSQVLITSVLQLQAHSLNSDVVVSPVSLLFDPNEAIDKERWSNHRKLIATCTHKTVNLRPPGWEGTEFKLEDQLNIMDSLMVGGSVAMTGIVNTPQQKVLVDHATWVFTPAVSDSYYHWLVENDQRMKGAAISIIGERVIESSGLLRFVIGALALLNSQEFITRTSIKPTDKKKMTSDGRKSKPAPAYEFVEFTAPHKVFVKELIENATEPEPGPKKAQHEVAAHFAHSRRVGDPNCEHDYQPNGPNRWICLQCGNKRWRRKTHLRGDPSIGIIPPKSRVVTSHE